MTDNHALNRRRFLTALGQRVLTRTEVGRFGDGIGNEKTGETPKRAPKRPVCQVFGIRGLRRLSHRAPQAPEAWNYL